MDSSSSNSLANAILAFCDSQTASDAVTQQWFGDFRACASHLQSGDVDAAITMWGVVNRSLSDRVPWTDDLLRDFYALIRTIRTLRQSHADIPTIFAK